MRRSLIVCGVIWGLTFPLRSAAQTADEDVQQLNRDLATLISCLKDIHDQASAAAVRDRVAALDKQIGTIFDRLEKPLFKPNVADQRPYAELTKLFEMSKRVDELDGQLARVAGVGQAVDMLPTLTGSKALATHKEEFRVARARSHIQWLTKAVRAYEIGYGRNPDGLLTLVWPPGGKPYVEEEWITDPWGRPYKYDATGPKNKGAKPDIWSEGPDPNDKTKIIGNWPDTGK